MDCLTAVGRASSGRGSILGGSEPRGLGCPWPDHQVRGAAPMPWWGTKGPVAALERPQMGRHGTPRPPNQ